MIQGSGSSKFPFVPFVCVGDSSNVSNAALAHPLESNDTFSTKSFLERGLEYIPFSLTNLIYSGNEKRVEDSYDDQLERGQNEIGKLRELSFGSQEESPVKKTKHSGLMETGCSNKVEPSRSQMKRTKSHSAQLGIPEVQDNVVDDKMPSQAVKVQEDFLFHIKESSSFSKMLKTLKNIGLNNEMDIDLIKVNLIDALFTLKQQPKFNELSINKLVELFKKSLSQNNALDEEKTQFVLSVFDVIQEKIKFYKETLNEHNRKSGLIKADGFLTVFREEIPIWGPVEIRVYQKLTVDPGCLY